MREDGPSIQDYQVFFDRIADASKHINHDDEADPAKLRFILEEAISSRPPGLIPNEHAGFHILASSSLSGGRYPCGSIKCRVRSASTGARFAALYADHIWIRDPFEGLSHHSIDDESYVSHALASLASLMEWKPLLLAGVASHLAPLCIQCAVAEANQSQLLKRPASELADELAEQFAETSDAIIYRTPEDEISVEYLIPTRYVGHRSIHMSPKGTSAKKYARFLGKRKSRKLSKSEARRLNIFSALWFPIIDEAVIQAVHRGLSSGTYASNLPIDLEVAARSTSTDAQHVSRLLKMLNHTVPIVENVPLATILKLRHENEGSFQLYRNRIALLQKDIKDDKSLGDATEQLKSEYAALETRIVSTKKTLWGKFRDQATIATGTVGAGLGLWLSDLLNPTWSAVAAAAGGVAVAQKLVSDALGARRPSSDDMQHPLYFLWRVKKSDKRKL